MACGERFDHYKKQTYKKGKSFWVSCQKYKKDQEKSCSAISSSINSSRVMNRQVVSTSAPSPTKLNGSSLCICSLKVKSIKNEAASVSQLVIDNQIDVLAISETWLGSEIDGPVVNKLKPPNYEFAHISRPSKRRVVGVGILYKLPLKLVMRGNTHDGLFTYEYMNYALILNGLSLKLCLIYRPPPSKKNDLSNAKFLLEWEVFLDKVLTIDQGVIILGDFNLHVEDKNDYYSQRLLNLLASQNMSQHVTDVTHVKGHILDLLITRQSIGSQDLVKSISAIDPLLCDKDGNSGADHYAVMAGAIIFKPSSKSYIVGKRLWHSVPSNEVEKTIKKLLYSCNTEDLSAN